MVIFYNPILEEKKKVLSTVFPATYYMASPLNPSRFYSELNKWQTGKVGLFQSSTIMLVAIDAL